MDTIPFDGIVLSGGGSRGIGELGVLHYHFESGRLDLEKVKVYAGTSIGSVISLLLLVGYEPNEIFAKAYTMTNIIPFPTLADLPSILTRYGVMSLKPLMDILEELIRIKIGSIPTLGELYTLTNKLFIVSVGNISKARAEFFTHITSPDLSVIDAVKMSCNLPFIFERISYNGDYYTDGGLTNNFPIDHPAFTQCQSILGVLIANTSPFGESPTFFSYVYSLLIMCLTHTLDLKISRLPPRVTLVKLSFNTTSILDFGIASSQKMGMFLHGYDTAKTINLQPPNNSVMPKTDGWDVDF